MTFGQPIISDRRPCVWSEVLMRYLDGIDIAMAVENRAESGHNPSVHR